MGDFFTGDEVVALSPFYNLIDPTRLQMILVENKSEKKQLDSDVDLYNEKFNE